MPIIVALVAAAAVYQAQKAANGKDGAGEDEGGGGGGGGGGLQSPPDITPAFLENKTAVELLPLEQTLTMLEWPIATVSFYRCPSPAARAAALTLLQRRTGDVLRANPWLGGWLVRGKGVAPFDARKPGEYLDATPRLWYDPSGEERAADAAFLRVSHDNVPLDPATPYGEYEAILGRAVDAAVKTNPEIVDRTGEPLFRVTAIPDPDGIGFALVVSLSHVAGDAHTFYRIHNMLVGRDVPVAALTPQRVADYTQQVVEKVGRQEADYVSHLTTNSGWMKALRLGSNLSSGGSAEEDEDSQLRGRVFVIDPQWVGVAKASHMAEGTFADCLASTRCSPMAPAVLDAADHNGRPHPSMPSTNDVLVSFFWRLVNPSVGLMAVNLRGRLGAVAEHHAGNYAHLVPYTAPDYDSPARIRMSLNACRRAGALPETADGEPTVLPRASSDLTFSVVTNWSSFLPAACDGGGDASPDDADRAAAAEEEGAEGATHEMTLVRHLPIINPTRMVEHMPRRMSFIVTFAVDAERIGCMLIAPQRATDEIDRCGVVQELIAEF